MQKKSARKFFRPLKFMLEQPIMKNGAFVISLDFELYWGVRDTRSLESYADHILGVRKVMPAMLDLFDKYDVKATFATVGFLFFESKEELMESLPATFPSYKNSLLSPYLGYLDQLGKNEPEDLVHYGPSLIRMIMDRKKHEMATHTFCHYYCLEDGQSPQQFRDDLRAHGKVAAKTGIKIRSIVFPRNQYSDDYLDVCREEGLSVFRGNEHSWLYEPRNRNNESKLRRAFRLLDSYINVSGLHVYSPESMNGLCNIPSSRFLRPYNPKLASLDGLRLNRIRTQMNAAAKQNKVFHLWWHPHNFGCDIEKNISFLEKILEHYRLLNRSTGFLSMTMEETANEFTNQTSV